MPRAKKAAQPVATAPSREYGSRVAQEEQMRAMPLPAQQSPQTGAAPATPQPMVPLGAETQRPEEPITSGLPTGPGPGPEVLGIPTLTPLQRLKRMYRANPNPDLLQLIILASDGFDE